MQNTAICKGCAVNERRFFVIQKQRTTGSGFFIMKSGFNSIAPEACCTGKRLKHLLRIMKLTTAILFIFCMQVSARVASQTITYSGKNVKLQHVFSVIEQQTGYTVAGYSNLVRKAPALNVEAKKEPLENFLEKLFSDVNLKYSIIKKTIFISPVKDAQGRLEVIEVEEPEDQKFPLHVTVTGEDGKPLVSASIQNRKTGVVVATNAEGVARLDVDKGDVIEISYVGFEKQSFTIKEGQSVLTVTLKVSQSVLDDVQVIAYGTTTKRLSTGNITTIKASDIAKQPVNNPILALIGRVPGVFISQDNGIAGGGVKIQIQGQNSIGSGNDPLYIIDGVPFISQLPRGVGGILGGANGSGSPFSLINPSDIESIDILKDADATAIYGSRAANGAILITTKKGKPGRTKVNVNMNSSWGSIARKLELLNTQQYLEMRHEAMKNDNSTIRPTDYDINGTWDTTRYTDWQKELFDGNSRNSTIEASVSGGTTSTQFIMGATYRNEKSIFPGTFVNGKGSVFFNISNTTPNQRLRVQLSGNYMMDRNKTPGSDITYHTINLAPCAPALRTAEGEVNWAQNANGISTWNNPLSALEGSTEIKTNNLISSLVINYRIITGLNIQASLGYTNTQTAGLSKSPVTGAKPEDRGYAERSSVFNDNNVNSLTFEPQITYEKAIAKGKLQALIGATILQQNRSGRHIVAAGYTSDLLLENVGTASWSMISSEASAYKYCALFGRLNYNWNDKYIIDLTARRDGSSNFGPDNRFNNFGAVGGAWIFTKEGFLSGNEKFLSFGKLRVSYGLTGNEQIGNFYINSYGTNLWRAVPYQDYMGLVPSAVAVNPQIEWEETRKLQFGLDLGFLKDRILLNTGYFHNRSSNQIVTYGLPSMTGQAHVYINLPALVQNTGWEITLNTTNVQTKHFTWTSNFNITISKNKLISFPNIEETNYYGSVFIGQPLSIQKKFKYRGVNPETGLYQFENKEGKIVSASQLNYFEDRFVTINPDPEFFGGFENTLSYKGFELGFFFQFVKQLGPNFLFGLRPGYASSGGYLANQPVSVLDRWQKPGDIAPIQRFSARYPSEVNDALSYAKDSDEAYKDASYIRLKNVNLSWQIPDQWVKKAKIDNCKIYFQAQNLLTITGFEGMDPENRGATATVNVMPPLRVINVGLQLGF